VRHAHGVRHVRVGQQELRVHHHGEEQPERDGALDPHALQHAHDRQRDRDPEKRPENLETEEPGRVGRHRAELSEKAARIDAAVVGTHRRVAPRDEVAEAEVEDEISESGRGEAPCPLARGQREPGVACVVRIGGSPLPEDPDRERRERRGDERAHQKKLGQHALRKAGEKDGGLDLRHERRGAVERHEHNGGEAPARPARAQDDVRQHARLEQADEEEDRRRAAASRGRRAGRSVARGQPYGRARGGQADGEEEGELRHPGDDGKRAGRALGAVAHPSAYGRCGVLFWFFGGSGPGRRQEAPIERHGNLRPAAPYSP